MSLSLQIASQCLGRFNVSLSRSLIAADEQDHYRVANLFQVNAVTWTVVDTQFRDTFTHGSDVTEISKRQAAQSNKNPRAGLAVTKLREPAGVFVRLANFNHRSIVSCGIQSVKAD